MPSSRCSSPYLLRSLSSLVMSESGGALNLLATDMGLFAERTLGPTVFAEDTNCKGSRDCKRNATRRNSIPKRIRRFHQTYHTPFVKDQNSRFQPPGMTSFFLFGFPLIRYLRENQLTESRLEFRNSLGLRDMDSQIRIPQEKSIFFYTSERFLDNS